MNIKIKALPNFGRALILNFCNKKRSNNFTSFFLFNYLYTNYSVILEKTDKIGKITYDLNLKNIKLPIKKGDKIGTLIIKEDNKKISEVDVTVKENLKKANMLELYGTYLKSILNGNINF